MIEYFVCLVIISLLGLFFVFGKELLKVKRLPLVAMFSLVLIGLLIVSYQLRDQRTIIDSFETEKTVMPLLDSYLNQEEPKEELLQKLEKVEPKYFIMGLQRYLQKKPSDSSVWITFGNVLQSSDNKELSLMAYQRAYRVSPDNLDLTFAYINAKISYDSFSQINEPDEEVIRILNNVLSKYPHNENALMLMGVSAYQGQNFELAVDAWSRLYERFKLKPEDRKVPENVMSSLSNSIAQAKAKAEQKESEADKSDSQGFKIQVQIALNDDLGSRINSLLESNENMVLYVYLKPKSQGRTMPLAAVRYPLRNSEFPVSIEMSEKNSLSGLSPFAFEELELSARISFSGQALSNTGDWESEAVVIGSNPIQESVQLLIDKVL